MKFFNELESDLREGIDKILKHPFLKRIEAGSLDKNQLQYFAKQYDVYCKHFPRFLAACAANITDDATRMPIVENLWEEHGEGNIKGSHRVLYEHFLKGCGINVDAQKEIIPLPSTLVCCENLLQICQGGHFLESLGALGPGTEFFTNEEYEIILSGLKKYDFLSEKDLEFWAVHISMDEEHYSEMLEAIAPWATTLENKFLIKSGAKKAVDLEILFWDGLEVSLPGRRTHP